MRTFTTHPKPNYGIHEEGSLAPPPSNCPDLTRRASEKYRELSRHGQLLWEKGRRPPAAPAFSVRLSSPQRPFFARVTVRFFAWFTAAVLALALLWATLAVAFAFPLAALRWPAALGFVACALGATYGFRRRPAIAGTVAFALFGAVLAGWLALMPRNDRDWQPDMQKTPWAELDGDAVTLHNFRNTERRTATDATVRWETRTFHLSALQHLDFYMVYWDSPHICHTMMSFDFGTEGCVCASIEARREVGENYSPLAGMFRRYELLYVLGSERDVVRLRAGLHAATDRVYLFRLAADPEIVRALFLDYVRSADELRTRPAWYDSLTTNCSTVIREHVMTVYSGASWDWRILANGHLDERLYAQRLIDRSLPLSELKKRSLINAAAIAAGDVPNFSRLIREGRPGF